MENPLDVFSKPKEKDVWEKVQEKVSRRAKVQNFLSKLIETCKLPNHIVGYSKRFRFEDGDSNIFVGDAVYKKGSVYLGEVVGFDGNTLKVKFGDRIMNCWLQEIRKCK